MKISTPKIILILTAIGFAAIFGLFFWVAQGLPDNSIETPKEKETIQDGVPDSQEVNRGREDTENKISDYNTVTSAQNIDYRLDITFDFPQDYQSSLSVKYEKSWVTIMKKNELRLPRVEIWDFAELPDRPYGIEVEVIQEELDNYVPKESEKMILGEREFGVNYLTSLGDTDGLQELKEIVKSIKLYK